MSILEDLKNEIEQFDPFNAISYNQDNFFMLGLHDYCKNVYNPSAKGLQAYDIAQQIAANKLTIYDLIGTIMRTKWFKYVYQTLADFGLQWTYHEIQTIIFTIAADRFQVALLDGRYNLILYGVNRQEELHPLDLYSDDIRHAIVNRKYNSLYINKDTPIELLDNIHNYTFHRLMFGRPAYNNEDDDVSFVDSLTATCDNIISSVNSNYILDNIYLDSYFIIPGYQLSILMDQRYKYSWIAKILFAKLYKPSMLGDVAIYEAYQNLGRNTTKRAAQHAAVPPS